MWMFFLKSAYKRIVINQREHPGSLLLLQQPNVSVPQCENSLETGVRVRLCPLSSFSDEMMGGEGRVMPKIVPSGSSAVSHMI